MNFNRHRTKKFTPPASPAGAAPNAAIPSRIQAVDAGRVPYASITFHLYKSVDAEKTLYQSQFEERGVEAALQAGDGVPLLTSLLAAVTHLTQQVGQMEFTRQQQLIQTLHGMSAEIGTLRATLEAGMPEGGIMGEAAQALAEMPAEEFEQAMAAATEVVKDYQAAQGSPAEATTEGEAPKTLMIVGGGLPDVLKRTLDDEMAEKAAAAHKRAEAARARP